MQWPIRHVGEDRFDLIAVFLKGMITNRNLKSKYMGFYLYLQMKYLIMHYSSRGGSFRIEVTPQ